jgi:outer membrane protein OmpA-like peptidoglycan-associated protein
MPSAIRVRLTPLDSGLGESGQVISDGARVSFTMAGPAGSKLVPEEPKPAKLTFEGRFIQLVRAAGEGDESRTLASLEGQLLRSKGRPPSLTFKGKLGDDGKPLGLVPEESVSEDDEQASDDDATREIRVLRFQFDEGQFQNVALEPSTELLVRLDPTTFRHCEVSVKLEVDQQEEAPATANDILDVLITQRNPAGPPVRRVRMVGMLFDANKCFLLPQALPGILTVVAMHRDHPSAKVLVVGHAEGDEDLAGSDLAFARAKAVGDYLTGKPGEWLNWFGKDKAQRSRWGTREVQLMLSALPADATPFYAGYASGITDDDTTAAIKAFQESKQLPVSGQADGQTIKSLVEAYLGLEDTTLSQDIVPVAHGCEGHFDDDQTEDGLVADDRRLEVFFFDWTIHPKPASDTSSPGSPEYPAWRRRLVETRDFEHHGIHVQIVDTNKQPVPLAEVHLEGPVSADAVADDHGFVSFFDLTAGTYKLSATSRGMKIGTFEIKYPTAKTVPGHQADDGKAPPPTAAAG